MVLKLFQSSFSRSLAHSPQVISRMPLPGRFIGLLWEHRAWISSDYSLVQGDKSGASWAGLQSFFPTTLPCRLLAHEERGLHGRALGICIRLDDAHPSLVPIHFLAFRIHFLPFWVLFWTASGAFQSLGKYPAG